MEIRRSKRVLLYIAALYGGALAFLIYKSVHADLAGRVMTLTGAALAAAVLIPCLVMFVRDPVVGTIDKAGVFHNSWGVGPIPWSDIACFSVDVDGEGGRVISLHLHDERLYLSKMNSMKASIARLRKLIGFAPIVIYPSNVDVPMDALVNHLRNHVPERPA